jgi:hypothetical protein
MDRASSTHGEKMNAYRFFMGKPEGKIAMKTDIGGRITLK